MKMKQSDRTELKKAIEKFYQKAGVSWNDRPVNSCVAEDFAIMLDSGRQATKSLAWLPGPSTKPNLNWILKLIIKGLLAQASDRVTPFAARMVVSRGWQSRMIISSMQCGNR